MSFTFRDSNEATTSLPLLIGLIGPSGGGKTYSALRLAEGIQKVRGGKIAAIDTEARRMLHYREKFQFKYLDFAPPFGSLRYCDALQAAAKVAEGGVVIVDSMSHEHEGPGGYLEYHEKELDRMAGDDWKKREKCTFTAWIKPAADRRRLINTILQTDCAFIFCFRSKEKLKIVAGSQPIPLGWQAIAGEEFAYEMTVRCLLPPGAEGVPDWSPDAFKNHVAKLGEQHKAIFPAGKQLDASIGEKLALWAKGSAEKPLIMGDASNRKTEGDNAHDSARTTSSIVISTSPARLEDYLDDIANVPAVGLEHKFKEAYRLFPDAESRAKLTQAKDDRKLELGKQP